MDLATCSGEFQYNLSFCHASSNTLGGDHEMDPSPIVLLGVTSHISRHTAQFLSTHEMTIDFPCTQILHLTMP